MSDERSPQLTPEARSLILTEIRTELDRDRDFIKWIFGGGAALLGVVTAIAAYLGWSSFEASKDAIRELALAEVREKLDLGNRGSPLWTDIDMMTGKSVLYANLLRLKYEKSLRYAPSDDETENSFPLLTPPPRGDFARLLALFKSPLSDARLCDETVEVMSFATDPSEVAQLHETLLQAVIDKKSDETSRGRKAAAIGYFTTTRTLVPSAIRSSVAEVAVTLLASSDELLVRGAIDYCWSKNLSSGLPGLRNLAAGSNMHQHRALAALARIGASDKVLSDWIERTIKSPTLGLEDAACLLSIASGLERNQQYSRAIGVLTAIFAHDLSLEIGERQYSLQSPDRTTLFVPFTLVGRLFLLGNSARQNPPALVRILRQEISKSKLDDLYKIRSRLSGFNIAVQAMDANAGVSFVDGTRSKPNELIYLYAYEDKVWGIEENASDDSAKVVAGFVHPQQLFIGVSALDERILRPTPSEDAEAQRNPSAKVKAEKRQGLATGSASVGVLPK